MLLARKFFARFNNTYASILVLKSHQSWLYLQRVSLRTSPSTNAGHSHYENIRHIKAAKDGARSNLFSNLTKQLEVAIRKGGSNNPERNPQLAQILRICKKANLPRATLERALTRTHDKAEFTLPISGPGGSCFLIACRCNNITEARAGLMHSIKLSKFDGKLDHESQEEFAKKRVIIADCGESDMSEDDAMEIALAIGAEEVDIVKDDDGVLLEFTCDLRTFTDVEEAITSSYDNLSILTSQFEHVPLCSVELNERDQSAVELFIRALHKTTEKQEIIFTAVNVSHNISNVSISTSF